MEKSQAEKMLRIAHNIETVLDMVQKERWNQLRKWGDQKHTDKEWKAIFDEEFAEFRCKTICGHSIQTCIMELTQATAVLCAWIQDLLSQIAGEVVIKKE